MAVIIVDGVEYPVEGLDYYVDGDNCIGAFSLRESHKFPLSSPMTLVVKYSNEEGKSEITFNGLSLLQTVTYKQYSFTADQVVVAPTESKKEEKKGEDK